MWLLSVFLIGATSMPAAQAAPAYLTISGSRIAQAHLTLKETIRFKEFSALDEQQFFSVPANGTFGGFLIERLPSREWAAGGLYQKDILATRDRRPLSRRFGPSVATLEPGRYRVHLLTDAPMMIRLRLDLGSSLSLTPTTPSPIQIKRLALSGPGAPLATDAHLRFTVGSDQIVNLATYSRLNGAGLRVIAVCIDDQTPCPIPLGGIMPGDPMGSQAWMVGKGYDLASSLSPGGHTAHFEAKHVGVVEAQYGLVHVFPPRSHPKPCAGTVCGG